MGEKRTEMYYYETKHMFCLRLFIPHMLALNLAHIQLRNEYTQRHSERECKRERERDWVSWCASTCLCDVKAKQQCGMENLIYTDWQLSDVPIYQYDIALPKVELRRKHRCALLYRCVDHAVECFENIAFLTIRKFRGLAHLHPECFRFEFSFSSAQRIIRKIRISMPILPFH